MQPYGFVSLGSHTGAWLQNEFEKYKNTKNILVEPVPYNLKELKQKIKALRDLNPTIYLSIEKNVSFSKIVEVLDFLREANLKKYCI